MCTRDGGRGQGRLTIRMRREQVSELLLTRAEFEAADSNAESGASLLALLADASEEPGDGAGYGTQRVACLRRAQHRVRFACKENIHNTL